MADNPINFADWISGDELLQAAAKSVRSLKTDVNTLSKTVGEDSVRIKAGFEAIATATQGLVAALPKLKLIDPAEAKLLTDYIKQVGDLKKAKEDFRKTEEAQATIQRQLSEATKQATKAVDEQKLALKAAVAANDLDGQRKAAALREIKIQTDQVSKALRGANSELTAAKGSYDALVIENNKLLASLHALEGGLNSGSQEAVKLKKQIFDNTQTLKDFDAETNRAFRSVGDYAKGFAPLVQELAKARAAQNSLAAGSEEYSRQQIRVAGFQTAAQKSAAQMGLSYQQAEARIEAVTAAIQPLANNLVRLEKEQEAVAQGAGRESEAFRKIGFQIESTKKQLNDAATATDQVATKSGGLTTQLGFNREGFAQFAGQLAVSYVGLQAIATGITAVFQANVKLSDALADVHKTTGLTADEADRLVDSLKKLDTRTSLAGLLDIAKVGGQLGILKGDIQGFVETMDIANQALGDDFTGGAEQIATELGKIAGVFRKELGPDIPSNLLAIGSAINEIGAEGAATAPFLADVALRVGAVASTSGVGLKNVLAYAAVLQEMGFSAEVSGTALGRLFSTLSSRTEAAFKIAQKANPALTLKEFTRLVNTDFNAAIQVFLRGLNAGGKTTTALSAQLDTLKLKSGEAKNVIITLAQNTELFAERQKTANDQLRDATSLSEEARIKQETLGGSVDRTTNSISNLFTSGAGGRFLKFLVDMVRVNVDDFARDFDNIGRAVDFIKNKFTGAAKPQEDFTKAIVANVTAIEKQAGANQRLLDSYTTLAATANRTEGQRLDLARTRAQLIAQFGTDEAEAIQKSINNDLLKAESHRQVLRQDLANYDRSTKELTEKAATYQQTLNQQEKGFTAAQIARIKEVAQARLDSERRSGKPFQLEGRSLNPELEPAIAANMRLLKTEQDLAAQSVTRGNLVQALTKLSPPALKATKDQTDANKDEAESEETLGRTARERAQGVVDGIKDEISANQRRIEELKQYLAQQGKLFDDQQITSQVYAQEVAGGQDLLTQLERKGTEARIRLVEAESAEKLAAAESDRVRQRSKKNVTQAELTDIEGQYAQRRINILNNELRDKAKIEEEDAKKRGAVESLNFRLPVDNIKLQKELEDADKTLEKGNAQTLKRMSDYNDELQRTYEKDVANKRDAEERKKDLIQRGVQTGTALVQAGFDIQGANLEAQAQREQAQYDRDIKNAGDNAKLKAAIEAEHERKQAAIKRKQAQNEKAQAIFSIVINTAAAILKDLSTYGLPFALPFMATDAVIGGIQLAVVNAQKAPAYFRGRENGPAEFAIVADKGPELIQEKKTGAFRFVAEEGLTYLNAGDKVFTAERTREMMAAAGNDLQALQHPAKVGAAVATATDGIQQNRLNILSAGRPGELAEIRDAIKGQTAAMKNLKQVTVNLRGEQAGAEISHNGNLTRYHNQRMQQFGD
jgi:TP901 family phage tail tape measure protein